MLTSRTLKNREDKEKTRSNILRSGFVFICVFQSLLLRTETSEQVILHYLERVLHAIFFIGHINCPPIAPEEFLPDKLLNTFKVIAPKAFTQYNIHPPQYTPYSILLEYMTLKLQPEDPDLFMKELAAINRELLKVYHEEGGESTLNEFTMMASVVCFSCIKDPSDGRVLKWAYGSSLSCKGTIQRKIMIDVSALHVWDKAISYAVCCEGNGPPITFPEQVHCRAYRFNTESGEYKEIPPCTLCNTIYNLNFTPEYQDLNKEEKWPYGNCAENESLSRLLQSDEDVRRQVCIKGDEEEILMDRDQIEKMFIEKYEEERKSRLKRNLTPRKFRLPPEWEFFVSSYPISSENFNIISQG
ncbi:uncharacterized protein [Engystomops pustulosus]|uniref:uncharacterized protein isoform X2 n=1 Tax=Engystomops pustulosus TaxID=76066 RepID=UPI003AFA6C51